jgi:peptidoglycan/xylan/chitin deacetylase (PgdA/CDA1 family)
VSFAAAEERRLADETVLGWEQVVALRRAGMGVQSHTRTHRVLHTLEPAEVAEELRGSRARLEEVLAEPVRAISYPVGGPVGRYPEVRRAVRDAGYELGFSNGTGVNKLALDALDVKRISLDAKLSDAFFRTMLALPWLAY